jgi:uncharacterized protein (UPF0305 family)
MQEGEYEEQEDRREEKNGGRGDSFVQDEEVEGKLEQFYKGDSLLWWPGDVDLSHTDEAYYCSLEEREKNPELHPPFLFTGEIG